MLYSEDYSRGLTKETELPKKVWNLANKAVSLGPSSAVVHISRAIAAHIRRRPISPLNIGATNPHQE
jgi:hypothetical protein